MKMMWFWVCFSIYSFILGIYFIRIFSHKKPIVEIKGNWNRSEQVFYFAYNYHALSTRFVQGGALQRNTELLLVIYLLSDWMHGAYKMIYTLQLVLDTKRTTVCIFFKLYKCYCSFIVLFLLTRNHVNTYMGTRVSLRGGLSKSEFDVDLVSQY